MGIVEYGIRLPQESTIFRGYVLYDKAITELYMKPGTSAVAFCTDLDMPGNQAFTLVPRLNDPKDKELLDLISDGKPHKAMLQLSKPFKLSGLNMVKEYKILSYDWIEKKNI